MQLSQEIFNILKGANIKLKLFDPMGNKTLDPEVSARFYAYDRDFLITIRDEDGQVELVVQAGASFNFDEHKGVLDSIKKAGHNAMAEYNIRKFDKQIEPKDFAHDVVKEDERTEKAMKDMQPSAVTGYYEITDFWKEHTQMWDKSVDEVMQMIYEWTWIEMTTATRDRDELAKRTLAIVVDALRNKKDDMTFDDMIAQLESKTEEVRRLRELSGIEEEIELTEYVWLLPALATAARVGGPALLKLLKHGKNAAGKTKVPAGNAAQAIIKNPGTTLSWVGGGYVFKSVYDVVEKVKEMVGDFMDNASITKFAEVVWKYKLPVAAVVAVLYGGKKLKDYMAGEDEKGGDTTINNYYNDKEQETGIGGMTQTIGTEAVNENPKFPAEVELAGDSIWIEDEDWESDYITVSNIETDTGEDGYFEVHVEHNGPWEIYTDTGFATEISKLIGKEVDWSEQGMQATGVAHLEAHDVKENVTEGYRPATGSLKTSYIKLPENTKLIINHTKRVNEEVRGSRSRNIKALFIENSAGERFRFPHKYLQGAKAMANHISNGGTPYDAIGESIIKLCEEVSQCTQFLRHVRTHKLTNEGNENIVETIKAKLLEMKNTIKSIQTVKGYNSYQNQDRPIVEEKDSKAVDIPGKFMYNTFKNADMNAVLETVARIVNEKDGMTDLTKQNISRLYDMIKNKEDFKLNIDPNDPEHPDNEDPIKYSGGMGDMAKLGAMLSYLAMNSKNDEVFNVLSHLGSELYNMPNNHVIMMSKIAKYLDKTNKTSSKEKVEVEEIAESILNDLRRKIS